MWLLNLIKKIWSKIAYELEIKRLVKLQKDIGFQVKSFTPSPGSNLTPTQTAKALRKTLQAYSEGKYKEIIIPDDLPEVSS